MSDLTELTLAECRDGLATGAFTAVELTDAFLNRMSEVRELNAFITETPEIARNAAKISDKMLAGGRARPLEGIPLAIKDNFCTQGVLTTAASHILDGFLPPYESTVTNQLWNSGAVLLGKTNMDEFGMGSTSGVSHYGPVRNPIRRSDNVIVIPGGSSGGAAAAVAAKACVAAIGTDTGGSIRQPASMCGVVGMKPTYGRCSRWGIIAYASSLDQAGVLAQTVEDAGILMTVISGYDERDSTSSKLPPIKYEKHTSRSLRGVRIGIPEEYRVPDLPEGIARIWEEGCLRLRDAGAVIVDVSLPHTKYALPAYYLIAMAEASSNLARYDGARFGLRRPAETLEEMYELTRAEGFGTEVKRRILLGTFTLSAGYYDEYYLKAQKVRNLVSRDFMEVFEGVDALLVPTSPTPAFPVGDMLQDPLSVWLVDVFTVPASLAGLPAISIPSGVSASKLPLGLQVIGRPFEDERVLQIGQALSGSN